MSAGLPVVVSELEASATRRRVSRASKWCGRALAAAAILLAPAVARAEGEPEEVASSPARDEARSLFKDGNVLFDAGMFEAALAKFEAAFAAWPNPKIILNIATTLRALGRNAEALQAYLRYSSEADPNPERKAEVDAICAELRGRVVTVRLAVAPEVDSLTLDGKPIDAQTVDPLYLEPGAHVLVSSTRDGNRELSFEAQPGDTRELVFEGPAPAIERVADRPQPEPATGPDVTPAGDRVGLWARADFDGRGRGVLGAAGLAYTLGNRWQLGAGALIGARRGAWAGLEYFLGDAALQPSLGLSAPIFFTGSAQVGIGLDGGLRWALGPVLFARLRAAVVHFPSAPDGYSKTVFVPALGMEWQL